MNGTVRLLSFLAIGAGVFGAALFFSLGAWHRASDFNEARALLISASAFGALLGALMLVSPVNGWLNGDFPERKRLLLYCVASIALVFAVIVVAPVWVPMPFKALAVFTSTGALIIVFLIVNEHGRVFHMRGCGDFSDGFFFSIYALPEENSLEQFLAASGQDRDGGCP